MSSLALHQQTVEKNCETLWYYSGAGYFANDQGEITGFSNWNFVYRLIFWIQDAWSGGEETRKVNQAVLATLREINREVQTPSDSCPTFYFRTFLDTVEPDGTYFDLDAYRHGHGHTYAELVARINQDPRFNGIEDITEQGRQITDTLSSPSFGLQLDGLTPEDREKVQRSIVRLATGYRYSQTNQMPEDKRAVIIAICNIVKAGAAFGRYRTPDGWEPLQSRYQVPDATLDDYRGVTRRWANWPENAS